MSGTFEIYNDKAGEFRFRLKASNGQAILASEAYKDKVLLQHREIRPCRESVGFSCRQRR